MLDEADVLDMRLRWSPVLQEQLQQIAAQPGHSHGAGRADTALDDYMHGRIDGPWMHDCRAHLRRALAREVAAEGDIASAISLLSSPDLSHDQQTEELEALFGEGLSGEDKSRLRQALAALHFASGGLYEARSTLQKDIDDPDTPDERRGVARVKLAHLASFSEPQSTIEQLISEDLRQAYGEVERFAWHVFSQERFEEDLARRAARDLSLLLAREGRSGQALELCAEFRAQGSDELAGFAAEVEAEVLEELGRPDQAAESGDYPAEVSERIFDRLSGEFKAAGQAHQARVMRKAGHRAAQKIMEESDSSDFHKARSHYLERLMADNDFHAAYEEACREDERDGYSPLVRKLTVALRAMRYQPEAWREELDRLSGDPGFAGLRDSFATSDLYERTIKMLWASPA